MMADVKRLKSEEGAALATLTPTLIEDVVVKSEPVEEHILPDVVYRSEDNKEEFDTGAVKKERTENVKQDDPGENLLTSSCCNTFTDKKPFPCEKCGKCFGRSDELSAHNRTHKDQESFSSKTCGKDSEGFASEPLSSLLTPLPIRLFDLVRDLNCTNDLTIIIRLRDGYRLLKPAPLCCKDICQLLKMKENDDGYMYSCKICFGLQSIRTNSFCYGKYESLFEIAALVFCFANDLPQSDVPKLVSVGKETVNEYYKEFREICRKYLERHPVCMGGNGDLIECDETHLGNKGKDNCAQDTNADEWLCGFCSRRTKEIFYAYVPNRQRESLHPIVQRHIAPGSIIVTDKAMADYSLNTIGYHQESLNHKRKFVHPEQKWLHTQNIQSFNSALMRKLKKRENLPLQDLLPHLAEFNFRHLFLPKRAVDEEGKSRNISHADAGCYRKFLDVLEEIASGGENEWLPEPGME